MTVKDRALEQLSDVNQRQLIDELAAVSALDDNHPIWAIIAMLGAVIGNTATEVARLRDEVIEVKGLVQGSLGRNGNPSQDSTPALTEIHETMNQVKVVLGDAAHLNRQMPKFLERLEGVLDRTRQAIAAIDSKLDGIASSP